MVAELPIREQFSKPEIQEIGSTSGCGCNFAYVMLRDGEWPQPSEYEPDVETIETNRINQEGLVGLLSSIDEDWIELYGIWANNYDAKPRIHEEIDLKRILESDFFFKEEGFVTVKLRDRA